MPTSQGGLEKSGSEEASDKIIELLKDTWSNTKGFLPKYGVSEIDVRGETDIKKINDKIFKLSKSKIGIFLGGDHSITYGLFKSFAEDNKDAGLVIFDAHPDVYHTFEVATHGDWLKYLIDEKVIAPENVMVIGVRNADPKELDYFKIKKIRHVMMHNIQSVELTCDSIMEFANRFKSFYLSIDIDVVDPAFAPGTGYAEPCGLTSREILYFVKRLKLLKGLKSADIVEVNPKYDVNNITSKLAARLVAELL